MKKTVVFIHSIFWKWQIAFYTIKESQWGSKPFADWCGKLMNHSIFYLSNLNWIVASYFCISRYGLIKPQIITYFVIFWYFNIGATKVGHFLNVNTKNYLLFKIHTFLRKTHVLFLLAKSFLELLRRQWLKTDVNKKLKSMND